MTSTTRRRRRSPSAPWWRRDDGAAVAEFPLVAVLVVLIALTIVQAAVLLHTRNTLIDAAVQGARYASLSGTSVEAGAERAQELTEQRFGGRLDASAHAHRAADGTITVTIDATLPLVGLIGPQAALQADGRALDEDAR